MTIEHREAAVVLRIFQEFVEGKAESSIVKRMNQDGDSFRHYVQPGADDDFRSSVRAASGQPSPCRER